MAKLDRIARSSSASHFKDTLGIQGNQGRAEAESIEERLNHIDTVLNTAKSTGVISSTREAAQKFVEVDFEQTGGE